MRVLTSLESLDAALAGAATHPILLFKHSETCGLSLQANDEMLAFVEDHAGDVPVYLVSVQGSRPVSDAIAARLGVRHASPQLLLVRGGVVCWHTSHLAITVDAIQAALERVAVLQR